MDTELATTSHVLEALGDARDHFADLTGPQQERALRVLRDRIAQEWRRNLSPGQIETALSHLLAWDPADLEAPSE